MSGILELIWHGHVTPERSLKDFKDWLKETKELDMIEVVDNTDTPIKNGET
jgi:hypothetical protein